MPSQTEHRAPREPWHAVRVASYCLAALFIVSGSTKVWGAQLMMGQFNTWNYPPSWRFMLGVVELLGGFLLITVSARAVGAALLGMIMLGAGVTHFLAQQWVAIAVPAVIFGTLAWIALRSPVRFVSPVEPGTPILDTERGSPDASSHRR